MSFVITLFSCAGKNGAVNDTEEKEQDGEKIYLLEKGFKIPESNIGRISNITCGYRSEHTVFDINNVTLTFFYGGNFEADISNELQMQSYPFFTFPL